MNNNPSSSRLNRHSDVTTLLNELESDRAGLVERLRRPTWLAPSLGALAALFISTPALPEGVDRGLVQALLIPGGILLVLAYQRVTGVKLPRFRVFEAVLFTLALLTTLLLFSVSLGLAASGFSWWIIGSAVAGFLVVTGLASLGTASMRERVLDVR